MLCTVQCRPASACARKSPPRGCTVKKQARQDKIITGLVMKFAAGPQAKSSSSAARVV